MKNQKGIALILALGILAVLTVVATSFALNMRLEYKIARNYNNRIKARYAAYASLQKAILELRENVKVSAFDYPANSTSSIPTASPNEYHTGIAVIEDEQGKLNVNNCTEDALQKLIRFLIDYAGVEGLSDGDAKKIMDVKPVSGFSHLEDIIVRSKLAGPGAGIDAEKLKLLSPYITVHGYVDPTYMHRSPININSASRPVIATAVLIAATVNTDTAWDVAGDIMNQGFSSWSSFDDAIAAVPYLSNEVKDDIKEFINPNGMPGSFGGVIKGCFHPGGYYRITATGTTADNSSSETVSAVVKISEMYVETTKDQFLKGTVNGVTIADHCPIYPITVPGRAGYMRPNAIKLGFWDDFDEPDVSGIGWSSATGAYDIRDEDGDGDKELVQTSSYGVFVPPITAGDFYFNAFFDDISGGVQMKNVGWLLFRGITPGSPCAIHNRTGMLEWGGAWAYDVTGVADIQFMTNSQAAAIGLTPADRYVYQAALRLWPDDNQDKDVNRTLYAYSTDEREIRILAYKSTAELKVRTSQPYQTYYRSDVPVTGNGEFGLYGDSSRVAWDNIRIIGPSGSFTSQTFSPPEGTVQWGTMTGTLYHGDEGNVVLSIVTAPGFRLHIADLGSSDPYVAIGMVSNSIRWMADFTQKEVNSAFDTMRCPILEDVTITYLPKTQLISYVAY